MSQATPKSALTKLPVHTQLDFRDPLGAGFTSDIVSFARLVPVQMSHSKRLSGLIAVLLQRNGC